MSVSTIETINQLNAFLRGELAAVQAYDKARLQLDRMPAVFNEISDSHQSRAVELTRHIADAGGEPEVTAGWWGAFTDSLQSVARLGGDGAVLRLLAEGETRGLREYEMAYPDLDESGTRLLEQLLLPQQRMTEAKMSLVIAS